MTPNNLNYFVLLELKMLRMEIDERYPFAPDQSIAQGSPRMDYVLWEMKQKERVRSEVDRRLRSLPLNQYLKEKKRLEPYLK